MKDKIDLVKATKEWVGYYNSQRQHQILEYKTSDEVYYGERRSNAA